MSLFLRELVQVVVPGAKLPYWVVQKLKLELEARQNGSAFIQGKMPEKMKDPRLFTLPYSLGNSKPFDTLADLESYGVGARPPFYVKKDFMEHHLPWEWQMARDVALNPFKDVLLFRKMVEFLGAIPINLSRNMWELEELIKKKIDWNMLQKKEMERGMLRLN
nr:hypothetical protein [Tanacetum cinerariifolium]